MTAGPAHRAGTDRRRQGGGSTGERPGPMARMATTSIGTGIKDEPVAAAVLSLETVDRRDRQLVALPGVAAVVGHADLGRLPGTGRLV